MCIGLFIVTVIRFFIVFLSLFFVVVLDGLFHFE